MEDKFRIQDDLYAFPYHYIPYFDSYGVPRIHRELSWGWDYLTYMSYTLNYISSNIMPNQSIIDIGCGDGFLLNQLNVSGIFKLGIDISEKAIKLAGAFSSDSRFKKESVYEIHEQFDMVVLNEVMEHISDEEILGFMNHVKTLVKKDGKLIITVPSLDIPVNIKHYRHYDLDLLKKEFNDAEFKLVHVKKLFIQSRLLKRIQWLLNNHFYLVKNRRIIKYLWQWHKKNTFESESKKAHHIFAVFTKI